MVSSESDDGEYESDRNVHDKYDDRVQYVSENCAGQIIYSIDSTLKDIWEFLFFVGKIDQTILNKFRGCVAKIANCSDIVSLLGCKKTRVMLRNCYRVITQKKDINATSLVVYHGPLSKPGWITINCGFQTVMHLYAPNICSMPECPGCLLAALRGQRCGQLLTGDLDLKKHYEELVCHIGEKKMKSTSICLVPHHGSKHSWNAALLEKTKNCRLWVASAGIRNAKYQHPHGLVIKDITKKGRAFWWVNENTRLEIRF